MNSKSTSPPSSIEGVSGNMLYMSNGTCILGEFSML